MSVPNTLLIDTKGFACPEPVLMVHRHLKGALPIHVLVDAEASKENITRAAENKGWHVTCFDIDKGEYRLELSRNST